MKQYGSDPLVGVPNRTKKGGKIRLGAVRLEGSDTLHSTAADPAANPGVPPAAGPMGQPVNGWSPEMGAGISAPAASSGSGEPGDALLAGPRGKLGGAAESSSCAEREEAPRILPSAAAQSSSSSKEDAASLSSAAGEPAGSSGSGNHGWWSHVPHRGRGARARRKATCEQRQQSPASAGTAGLNGSRRESSSRKQSRAPPAASAGMGARGRGGSEYGGGRGHVQALQAAGATLAGSPGESTRAQGRASSAAEAGSGGGQGGAESVAAGYRASKGALRIQGTAAPPQSKRQAKKHKAVKTKEGPKKQKQRAQPVLVF